MGSPYTIIVRIGANAILCRGGSRRGRCPTDVAGVLAACLAVLGYGVSRGIAFSGRTIGRDDSNSSDVGESINRRVAVRRALCKIVLRSTGRYTCTTTRRANGGLKKSCDAFVSLVGGRTGRLNYASARFGGTGNLPSRGR